MKKNSEGKYEETRMAKITSLEEPRMTKKRLTRRRTRRRRRIIKEEEED